jgi:hypothetical protein
VAPVYKFSNVGGFTSKTFYTSILAGNPKFEGDNGSVVPLGEFTLAATTAFIEFTNIPQTYTHLQIRGIARGTRTGRNVDNMNLRFNSDTTTSYSRHALIGDGSTVVSSGAIDQTFAPSPETMSVAGAGTNTFGAFVIDILDYKNTNKFKTIRVLSGIDNNGDGKVALSSGVWRKNPIEAISTIRLYPDVNDFAANTNFALYGVLA